MAGLPDRPMLSLSDKEALRQSLPLWVSRLLPAIGPSWSASGAVDIPSFGRAGRALSMPMYLKRGMRLDSHPTNPAPEPKCWHVAHALAGWSAFIEHLQHRHGVENPPEDDLDAWRLHEELHENQHEARS